MTDAALIVAMRNALPALLASLASKDAENAELRAFAQQATKSLTSLAGGGSENFIRRPGDEIYLADVPYCEPKLRERISRLHKQIDDFAERYAQAAQEPKQLRVQLHAAESRLTTALAALGEAREALEPFARKADKLQTTFDLDRNGFCSVLTQGSLRHNDWRPPQSPRHPCQAQRARKE